MRPIFTKLLADRQSHLSRHMRTAYPATLELRKLVREAAGDIIVAPGAAHAGTVGTAFDMLSGFMLVEGYVPLDPGPTRGWRPVHGLVADSLIEFAHEILPGRKDDDNFYRAVWVLAELGAIVRSGYSSPDGALERFISSDAGAEDLLNIAPADGIRQLRELEQVATEHVYGHLSDPLKPSASFPAVADIVQAEADIIAGDMLLDYKTGAGTLHKTTGARAFLPTDSDIYQILGYALMDDPDDGYGVSAVGLYVARYGHSSVWELPQLLGITAGGHAVNLDAARASFRFALEADYEAALAPAAR